VFLHVHPGHTQHYSIKIGPGNQPGTYWYHSHMHELSEHQLMGGLSGLIIIDGARKHLGRALSAITERTISLKHIQIVNGGTPTDDNGIKMAADKPGYPSPNVRLVNGLLLPTLTIHPGEVQLWHIANIGADAFYKLALDGNRFIVLSQDANSLDHPQARKTLLIPPGNRFDVLVVGPKKGVTRLRTLPYAQGDATFPERVLATLRSAGPRRATPPLPTAFLHDDRLDNAPIAKRRIFTFDEGGTGADFHFLINQQVFDANRVDARVKLGTTEEWTLLNTTEADHPFHIHVDNFQIMSINGVPYHAHNVQDTGIIPKHSWMVIRIAFDDWVGKFVFHCHILGHEDLGMMKTVLVYKDPKSPVTIAPRS
jgi:FtsP/CotA-like multicopper oxidase with cupredoxin domain